MTLFRTVAAICLVALATPAWAEDTPLAAAIPQAVPTQGAQLPTQAATQPAAPPVPVSHDDTVLVITPAGAVPPPGSQLPETPDDVALQPGSSQLSPAIPAPLPHSADELRHRLTDGGPSGLAFASRRSALYLQRTIMVRVEDGAARRTTLNAFCKPGRCEFAPDDLLALPQSDANGRRRWPWWAGFVRKDSETEFLNTITAGTTQQSMVDETPARRGEAMARIADERRRLVAERAWLDEQTANFIDGDWPDIRRAGLARYDLAIAEADRLSTEDGFVYYDVTFRQAGFLIEQREAIEAFFNHLTARLSALLAAIFG